MVIVHNVDGSDSIFRFTKFKILLFNHIWQFLWLTDQSSQMIYLEKILRFCLGFNELLFDSTNNNLSFL